MGARHPRSALVGCWLAVATLAAAGLAAEDPWTALANARAELERQAWTADFTQTFVPSGFSSGELETGRLSLALPGRLRWDYAPPDEKVFLVSGDEAYSWNPGETTGRRTLLQPAEREHLALLELDTAALRARYDAAPATLAGGRLEITLTPRTGDVDIRSATLTLEADLSRVVALAYSDLEGNTTRFELSGHHPAEAGELFEPPAALDWLED